MFQNLEAGKKDKIQAILLGLNYLSCCIVWVVSILSQTYVLVCMHTVNGLETDQSHCCLAFCPHGRGGTVGLGPYLCQLWTRNEWRTAVHQQICNTYIPTPFQAFEGRRGTVPLRKVSNVIDSQSQRSVPHQTNVLVLFCPRWEVNTWSQSTVCD